MLRTARATSYSAAYSDSSIQGAWATTGYMRGVEGGPEFKGELGTGEIICLVKLIGNLYTGKKVGTGKII